MEIVLTFGLVSVILGTASGAQNIGIIGAIGVGAYIALAGLWGSPISGASMNPARTFGPDAVGADFHAYWVYVVGRSWGPIGRRRHRASSSAVAAAAAPGPRQRKAHSRRRLPTRTRPEIAVEGNRLATQANR